MIQHTTHLWEQQTSKGTAEQGKSPLQGTGLNLRRQKVKRRQAHRNKCGTKEDKHTDSGSHHLKHGHLQAEHVAERDYEIAYTGSGTYLMMKVPSILSDVRVQARQKSLRQTALFIQQQPPNFFNPNLFCELKPHGKFQNHMTTPYWRKVNRAERKNCQKIGIM